MPLELAKLCIENQNKIGIPPKRSVSLPEENWNWPKKIFGRLVKNGGGNFSTSIKLFIMNFWIAFSLTTMQTTPKIFFPYSHKSVNIMTLKKL